MYSGEGNDGKRKWPAEVVFTTRVSSDGTPGAPVHVAGTAGTPAIKPAVASDGAGVTLIAYEKHPSKGDVPIKIAFRVLKK